MVYVLSLGNYVLLEGLMRIIRDEDTSVILLHEHGMIPNSDPDIVIFDSFKAAPAIKNRYPEAKLLFMDSGLPDAEIACLLLCHQVSGIISPHSNSRQFHKALKLIMNGDIWIDQANLKAVQCKALMLPKNGGIKGLTEQNMRIATLIVEGRKNKEIAKALHMSEATVKSHVSRIYKILNVKNRTQLATLCSRNSQMSVSSNPQ